MIDGEFHCIPQEEYVPPVRTQILADTIEPTWHPVTGEFCSSRTGMQKIAKAHGMEELGNERIPKKEYKPNKEAIIEALKHNAEKLGLRWSKHGSRR